MHSSVLIPLKKNKASNQPCLYKFWSSRSRVKFSAFGYRKQRFSFSPAVLLAAETQSERETVDKESDVKNLEVKVPPRLPSPLLPFRYERSRFLSRYAMLEVGQFYLWLCNGMKEQLCSPLQGGSVYPHYLVNAPLASCCYGARG